MIVILFTVERLRAPRSRRRDANLTPTEILNATKGIRAITAVGNRGMGPVPGPH